MRLDGWDYGEFGPHMSELAKPTDEIEITPEMIEAGEDALLGADIWPLDHRRDLAVEVYRAMCRQKPKRTLTPPRNLEALA